MKDYKSKLNTLCNRKNQLQNKINFLNRQLKETDDKIHQIRQKELKQAISDAALSYEDVIDMIRENHTE